MCSGRLYSTTISRFAGMMQKAGRLNSLDVPVQARNRQQVSDIRLGRSSPRGGSPSKPLFAATLPDSANSPGPVAPEETGGDHRGCSHWVRGSPPNAGRRHRGLDGLSARYRRLGDGPAVIVGWGTGQQRCRWRKSNVAAPWIACGPLKNSISVRSPFPRLAYKKRVFANS